MKNPVTVVTTAPENEHLSRVEDAWKTGLHGLSSSADMVYITGRDDPSSCWHDLLPSVVGDIADNIYNYMVCNYHYGPR